MDDKIEIGKSINEQRGNARNMVKIATDGTDNTSSIISRQMFHLLSKILQTNNT